jgi:secreted trypsin-like serine protease
VKLLLFAVLGLGVDDVRIGIGHDVIGGAADADTHAVVAVEIEGHVVCSGSLVAARAVLTAAHCSWFPGLSVRVSGAAIEVVDVMRPEGATPGSFAQDLAVLELGEAVEDVEPLEIGMLHEGEDALRMVGFGRDDAGREGERRSVVARAVEVTAESIRIEGAEATVCRGDSGGPALVGGMPERIVAVASHGDAACERFAVLQRVEPHAAWIEEALGQVEEEGAGCRAGGTGTAAGWMMVVLVAGPRRARSS